MPHRRDTGGFGRGRSRSGRTRVAGVAAVAVAGVVTALVMPATSGAAGAAGTSPILRNHTAIGAGPAIAVAGGRYSRLVPLCAPPRPGRNTCFAIRSAPVSVQPGTALPNGVRAQAVLGNGPAGGYSPNDLASLYGFSRFAGGKGQTIGIVDWFDDSKALADLDAFDSHYGFPAETTSSFAKVNQNGKAAPLPPASAKNLGAKDSSPEITLDIQSARAVCATCRIVLVEANGPFDTELAKAENTAVRLGATEVSNSFGSGENTRAGAKSYKKLAKAFNHKGVVITASTGDHGWYSWDFANPIHQGGRSFNVANTPSTFPTVVAVGGTKLLDTGKRAKPVRKSETVWNENGLRDRVGARKGPQEATGGGCSRLFKAKRWQHKVAGYTRTGCGAKRLGADVSAIADPNTGFDVFDSYDGLGWFTVGGTSLSSPVVAAMWALAGGAHKVAYPALTLYGNAKKHRVRLHDVTAGGNGFCDGARPKVCRKEFRPPTSPNRVGLGLLDCGFKPDSNKVLTHNHQCEAAKGYDGPSGIGTPNGLGAFSPLSPSAKFRIPKLHKGHKAKFRAKTRDPFPGGGIAKFRWSFGDGSHSKKAHPLHAYSKAKAYTIKLTITDVFGLRRTIHKKIHVKH
jgi:hypothetical protein